MAAATLMEAFNHLLYSGRKMREHQPWRPEWPTPDRLAASILSDQLAPGRNLLCNCIILFDDGGGLLGPTSAEPWVRADRASRLPAGRFCVGPWSYSAGIWGPIRAVVGTVVLVALQTSRA